MLYNNKIMTCKCSNKDQICRYGEGKNHIGRDIKRFLRKSKVISSVVGSLAPLAGEYAPAVMAASESAKRVGFGGGVVMRPKF